MRGILRPIQPHVPPRHSKHVTFDDRPQVIRSRSNHASSTVSSRAPPSAHADAGSFRPCDEELGLFSLMQTLPHQATIARGKTTDEVIRYLTRKTRLENGHLFNALCAKQLGTLWVKVRRMVGEKGGERVEAWEEDVRKKLVEEERSWKKADKEERKRVREMAKRELEKFVRRHLRIKERRVFADLSGKEMGYLCTSAVRTVMKQRQRVASMR